MSTRFRSKQVTPSSPSSQNGRLFTDSDEIRLLKAFYKSNKSTLSSQSTPSSSSSSSTTPITVDSQTFERINKALDSKFTLSQITDKLRRLRIKYHKQARSKSLIKTPHDQDVFNIARKIWGKKMKLKAKKVEGSFSSDDNEEDEVEVAVTGNDEVDLEAYPALVSEFSKYLPVNSVWREGLKMLGTGKLREMNEQWMSIGIEEAKIVTKKAELVKEQTQLVMQMLENGTGN